MDSACATAVTNASAASPGTVQGAAAVSMLKKTLEVQESSAAQLIAALPQVALATSGAVGTRLDTFA
jgi:Putative motility protein